MYSLIIAACLGFSIGFIACLIFTEWLEHQGGKPWEWQQVITITLPHTGHQARLSLRALEAISTIRLTTQEGITIEGATNMNLEQFKQVRADVTPVNRRGLPAAIESGSGKWSSSNTDAVTVEGNPANELSATIKANAPGVSTIKFQGDADLGEGVRELTAELAVNCTPAGAVVFNLAVGEPEDQPAPAPAPTPTPAPPGPLT